ncbi:MAG: hypothetical protein JW741_09800 [Sedimentisphaerales bacterium]|nr:hypothetical protein [Sedimentisphaerales bacterium]
MRTCKVSDELYEQLKSFVVDPFDDTPEAVIGRLIEIVNKAKSRWSPFEEEKVEEPKNEYASFPASPPQRHQEQEQHKDIDEVVLL